MFDDLPEDIRLDILRRLDPKFAAGVVSAVSKTWHRLITTHCIPTPATPLPFTGQLLLVSPAAATTVKLLIRVVDSVTNPIAAVEPSYSAAALKAYRDGTQMIDSCNGLDLCSVSAAEFFNYLVVNRCTGQRVTVRVGAEWIRPHHASLAYDPSRSGFFRIVEFSRFVGPMTRLHVYYSETKEWKWVRVFPTGGSGGGEFELSYESLFFSGAVYRLSVASGYLLKFEIDGDLSSENQEKSKMEMIKLPKEESIKDWSQGCIGVCNNSVHLMSFDDKSRLQIWLLNDNKKWTLRSTVLKLLERCELMGKFVKPLGFHPNKDVALVGSNSDPWGSVMMWIYFIQDEKDSDNVFVYKDSNWNPGRFWFQDWRNILAFPCVYSHLPFASGTALQLDPSVPKARHLFYFLVINLIFIFIAFKLRS